MLKYANFAYFLENVAADFTTSGHFSVFIQVLLWPYSNGQNVPQTF